MESKSYNKTYSANELLNFQFNKSQWRKPSQSRYRYIEAQYQEYLDKGEIELADGLIKYHSANMNRVSTALEGASAKFAFTLFENCPDQRIIDWLALPEIGILYDMDAYGDIVTCYRIRFMKLKVDNFRH